MKMELSNHLQLRLVDIKSLNDEMRVIFRKLICNDGHPFIWTLSENSAVFYSDFQLENFLLRDFGSNYLLFIISYKDLDFGFVGLTNITDDFVEGELLIGIINEFRKRYDFLIWWIGFLQEVNKVGIRYINAKILKENKYVISLANKLGFMKTINPTHFSNATEDSLLFYRETTLVELELEFIKHLKSH